MDTTSPAIERLYQVFALHRASLRCYCTCCVTPEDNQRLLSKRLRELSANDLWYYLQMAMTTWGEVEDFKHFLPRIIEVVVDDGMDFGVFEVVPKLAYAEWSQWPEQEQAAVLSAFDELWLRAINTESCTGTFEFIDQMKELVPSVRRWLDVWTEQKNFRARYHLAEFANEAISLCNPDGSCRNCYWLGHEPQWREVIEWLRQPVLQDYLDAALLDAEADDDLANALAALEQWRKYLPAFVESRS